jgi:hypothetical protein
VSHALAFRARAQCHMANPPRNPGGHGRLSAATKFTSQHHCASYFLRGYDFHQPRIFAFVIYQANGFAVQTRTSRPYLSSTWRAQQRVLRHLTLRASILPRDLSRHGSCLQRCFLVSELYSRSTLSPRCSPFSAGTVAMACPSSRDTHFRTLRI